MGLKLRLMPDSLSVYRLDLEDPLPAEILLGEGFSSITRTAEECSIVCSSGLLASYKKEEAGWKLLKVEGPLEFSMLGIIQALSTVLADAGVSIFVLSTFDTDYLLVKEASLSKALESLKTAGYELF